MDISLYYDAQTAVLGSLLIAPARLAGEIFHTADPEDFADPSLRTLYSAARGIWRADKPLDPVTLLSVAGEQYSKLLAEVLQATPTAENWEVYLKLLKDNSQLKRLYELADALREARDIDAAKKLLAGAEDILASRPRRKRETYGELISDFLDRQRDPSPPDYLDFGISALNSRLHVGPGRFVILGADSSTGKTAFALQIAVNIAGSGKRVGFASYETSRADSVDRILANRADFDLQRAKRKQLTEMELQRVADEKFAHGDLPIEIFESSGYTVDDLRTEVLARRLDVLIVDYVQFVSVRNRGERWQTVTEISMALHGLAQQLGVVVIGLSQVTPPEPTGKGGNRRALAKGDLRESRQLINDADVILMMDLVQPNDPSSLRVLKVDKNKDGPLGKIYLKFDPSHMRFTPVMPPPADSDEAASRERAEQMDANKAAREEKERRKYGIAGQTKFVDLPDDGSPLPF